MALLSLQTGLVDLTMPQRVGAMSIILFIVVGSLLQSMHDIVEPILLALSASHTYAVARHARVLALCTFLFVFPLYMTIFLCLMFEVDFWTLVVVSTCALTSVQVLGALIVYALFLYDAMQKESGWESLDDMVYIARGITRALEFIVALLVVGAGVRESMLLSSEGRPLSWLNGTVLAVHCYYNVYQRLQSGWSSFLLRRDAARKIHSLPCATAEQLDSRAHDVCAICYTEMKSARVTPCGHLFHATCLKKWLYVQDRCPLCATKVTAVRSEEAAERVEGTEEWFAPGQQTDTGEEHSVSSARRDCHLAASGEQTDISTRCEQPNNTRENNLTSTTFDSKSTDNVSHLINNLNNSETTQQSRTLVNSKLNVQLYYEMNKDTDLVSTNVQQLDSNLFSDCQTELKVDYLPNSTVDTNLPDTSTNNDDLCLALPKNVNE
uniref:(California timema) hypothetical protein n=1 Tax=Timema californicum TaxID=61474 RepID=A0A7R9JJT7_TIMCA|nr:unnamed protein product [Timema californicum]